MVKLPKNVTYHFVINKYGRIELNNISVWFWGHRKGSSGMSVHGDRLWNSEPRPAEKVRGFHQVDSSTLRKGQSTDERRATACWRLELPGFECGLRTEVTSREGKMDLDVFPLSSLVWNELSGRLACCPLQQMVVAASAHPWTMLLTQVPSPLLAIVERKSYQKSHGGSSELKGLARLLKQCYS